MHNRYIYDAGKQISCTVLMNGESDFIERVRRTVIPPLGGVVSLINELGGLDLYVQGTTSSSEFVGRVPMGEESFEEELCSMNFVRNPLASLKRLRTTGYIEEGSFRWTPPENSVHDESMQLHVVIYDGKSKQTFDDEYTYVYAHWEYAWDKAPIKHYKGAEIDEAFGVGLMQRKLDTNDIEYERRTPR